MLWLNLFILCSWILLIVFWLRNRSRVKPTRQLLESRFQRASYSAPAFLGVCLILAGHFYAPVRMSFWQMWDSSRDAAWFGSALVLAGLCLALWARRTLGNNWSARVALKVEHQLVTKGPYGLVRHPIYSGLLLMTIGTAVTTGSVVAVPGLLLVILGACIKLRYEEALMVRAFGDTYRAYKARVRGLIPFVW